MFLGAVALFGCLAAPDPNSTSSYQLMVLKNPMFSLLGGGIGIWGILSGIFLIGISEIIGLVMSAEDSFYRMANALEATQEYQLDRLVNSKPTMSVEAAGEALKKAFGTPVPYAGLAKDNPEDKYGPNSGSNT